MKNQVKYAKSTISYKTKLNKIYFICRLLNDKTYKIAKKL